MNNFKHDLIRKCKLKWADRVDHSRHRGHSRIMKRTDDDDDEAHPDKCSHAQVSTGCNQLAEIIITTSIRETTFTGPFPFGKESSQGKRLLGATSPSIDPFDVCPCPVMMFDHILHQAIVEHAIF